MYILLYSISKDQEASESFREYNTKEELILDLIQIFEEYLETTKQGEEASIEYLSDDLYNFLDKTFGYLACLSRDNDLDQLYTPHSSEWIKQEISRYLSNTMSQQRN